MAICFSHFIKGQLQHTCFLQGRRRRRWVSDWGMSFPRKGELHPLFGNTFPSCSFWKCALNVQQVAIRKTDLIPTMGNLHSSGPDSHLQNKPKAYIIAHLLSAWKEMSTAWGQRRKVVGVASCQEGFPRPGGEDTEAWGAAWQMWLLELGGASGGRAFPWGVLKLQGKRRFQRAVLVPCSLSPVEALLFGGFKEKPCI